jgi:hypothetical protein
LIQGQGQHYPTKALLKHYVPLEGIITTPASDVLCQPERAPVENTMAPHARTMAQDATVLPGATVAPRDTNKYDDDIKINHHQRAQKAELVPRLWKTTVARPCREREKKLPMMIFSRSRRL